MSGILNVVMSGGASAPRAPFNYVTALLTGNGTNGGNNNTFIDTSTISATITRNGNSTQGLFTPFSQPTGYWSNYQSNVSSDYINFTTSPGTLFQFAGDFTVETWVYLATAASGSSIWVTNDGSANYFALNLNTANFNIYLNSSGSDNTIPHGLTIGQWAHVAMVRSGSTITLYTNGVVKGTLTNSSTLGYASPSIARNGGGGSNSWYLSNLRIVKSAVYTSAFTPPTSPLTNIANTSLLTCQNYSFKDNSSNALVATINGTPQILQFAPFTSGTAWSSTNGGSLYFDGSGDYLTNTTNTFQYIRGTGDWTFECFVYPFAYGGTTVGPDLFAVTDVTSGSGGGLNNGMHINLGQDINNFRLISNASGTWADNITAGTGGGPPLYAWSHMAMVREGDRISIFKNGTRVNTGTGFASYQFSPSAVNAAGNYSLAVQDGRALAATNATADFGTGNFTAEFFVYRPNTDFASGFMLSSGSNSSSFEFRIGDNNCIIMHTDGGNVFTVGTVNQNQWVHCALVRSGSNMSAWIAGTRVYNNTSYTKNFTGNGNTYVIGGRSGSGGLIYNANMRLSTNVYYDPNLTTITPPVNGFGYSSGDKIVAGVSNVLLNNTGLPSLTVLTGSPFVWPWGPLTNSTYSKAANSVVGRFNDGGIIRDFNGFIAFPRFQQNAVYSASASTITVPTAALGNDGNTLQLLRGTNGQVLDSSLKNNWETVGNAQISTAQSKFGGSSIAFDGSGDYLLTKAPSTTLCAFGTGDFTIEFWVYFNTVASQVVYDGRPSGTQTTQPTIYMSGSGVLFYYVNGANVITGATLTSGQWYHIAVCRSSSQTKMFLNGVQTGSTYADTVNYTNTVDRPMIGNDGFNLTNALNGYIDDLRVTKGYAVYTTNFPVPGALPTT